MGGWISEGGGGLALMYTVVATGVKRLLLLVAFLSESLAVALVFTSCEQGGKLPLTELRHTPIGAVANFSNVNLSRPALPWYVIFQPIAFSGIVFAVHHFL